MLTTAPSTEQEVVREPQATQLEWPFRRHPATLTGHAWCQKIRRIVLFKLIPTIHGESCQNLGMLFHNLWLIDYILANQ